MEIEPYEDSRLEEIVELSLRAWEPVFRSIEAQMDADAYRELYPDWRATQSAAVESSCSDEDLRVWIATEESRAVGFVAARLHVEKRIGEIYMIAVDPAYQRRGIATALTQQSLDWFRNAGMSVGATLVTHPHGSRTSRRGSSRFRP